MIKEALFWAKFIKVVYSMYEPNVINPQEPVPFPKGWKLVKNIVATAGISPYEEKEFIGIVVESTEKPNKFAVLFHGSQTVLDFLDDFEFGLVNFNLVPNGGKTEYGFTRFYESVTFVDPKSGIPMKLKEYLKKSPKDSSFVVCGHSLGASLSILHSIVLSERNFVIENYTFASPMVGNQRFVERYNSLITKSYRFANKPDIVTKLPGSLLGYEHINTLFEVNSLDYPEIKHSISSFHSLDTYMYCLKKLKDN